MTGAGRCVKADRRLRAGFEKDLQLSGLGIKDEIMKAIQRISGCRW